jgi:hypothetical protein
MIFYFLAILYILFGKILNRLSRILNGSGRNYLPGHVKHFVWKVEEKTAKIINDDICLYFFNDKEMFRHDTLYLHLQPDTVCDLQKPKSAFIV